MVLERSIRALPKNLRSVFNIRMYSSQMPRRGRRRGETYVHSYVAHHCCMIRQSDILRLMGSPIRISIWRTFRVMVDDECAFHIDFDCPRMYDGAVYLRSICAHAEGHGGVSILRLNARAQRLSLRRIRRHCGLLLAFVPGRIWGLRRHQEIVRGGRPAGRRWVRMTDYSNSGSLDPYR